MPEFEWDYCELSDMPSVGGGSLQDLPEDCLWKQPLKNLFENIGLLESIGIPHTTVYLLTGPQGNGRHLIGNAILGEFQRMTVDPENIGVLNFWTEDFSKELKLVTAQAMIRAAFEKGTDFPVRFLIFEEMDSYSNLPAICNAIAQEIENLDFEETPTVILCYTEDEELLSKSLKDAGLVLRVNSPSAEERAAFFRNNLEWSVENAPGHKGRLDCHLTVEHMTAKQFAEKTEGMTYSELALLMKYVKLAALARKNEMSFELSLYYDASDFDRYVYAVKNHAAKQGSGVIQIRNVVQGNGTAQQQPSASDNEAAALAMKEERSLEDNLRLAELIAPMNY